MFFASSMEHLLVYAEMVALMVITGMAILVACLAYGIAKDLEAIRRERDLPTVPKPQPEPRKPEKKPGKRNVKCPHCARHTELKIPVREVIAGDIATLVYKCQNCSKEISAPA